MGKFHTSKSLGQNFINDLSVIDDIISAANVSEEDFVIEIGPGMGALTEGLVEDAGKLLAIEIDDRLIPILRAKFGMCENFSLVHGDILDADLAKLIEENREGFRQIKILGNLPYYITSPIIMKVLEAKLPIESFTIMVQKEVAERLSANPGTKLFGAITAAVQYYAEITYIRTVTRDLFTPAPKVDSAVIRLDIRKEPPVELKSEELFFELIHQSFLLKRKTLANSLNGFKGMDKEAVASWLGKAGIDPMRRAETLSLSEFASLANLLI